MAPKAKQAKPQTVTVDKTFGMKNKNKSKVVQKYIKQITSNSGGSHAEQEAARKAKKDKEKAEQENKMMASLFGAQVDKRGRAYDPAAKKAAKKAEEDAIAAGKKLDEKIKKGIIEGIANSIRLTNAKGVRMSELGGHPIIHALKDKYSDTFKTLQILSFMKAHEKIFWVDDPDSTNPTVRCQDDVDAETAPDDRPIEEILEDRRACLPPGGTPVTAVTFKAWKEKKEAERLALVEEEVKNSKAKNKGSVAGVLSGKDLFTYDPSLFVDDAEAVGADVYDEMPEDAPESDGENGPPKAAAKGEDEEEEEEEEEDGGAASSSAAPAAAPVPINKELFMEGGDLPDDLDDLSD